MEKNQSTISNLNELVAFLKESEKLVNHLNEQLDTPDFFGQEVFALTKDNVNPESDKGKDLVSKGNFIRRIGSKFFDLFKITFTVSFAGVTLIHFEFPKLNNRILGGENNGK